MPYIKDANNLIMQVYKSLDLKEYMDAINQHTNIQFHYPEGNSKLMTHEGNDYLHKIELGKVVRILRSDVLSCKYAMQDINVNEQLLCFALIQRACQLKLTTYATFYDSFGFDVKFPPDKLYMMYMLYMFDKDHPLFKNQPSKAEASVSQIQKEALVKTYMKNKQLDGLKSIQIDSSYKTELSYAATGYVFYKFKSVEHEKNRFQLIKMTASSPMLRDVIASLDPDEELPQLKDDANKMILDR